MKALLPLIFLAAPLAAQTNAVIAYDSFDYPAGNLGFMAGGSGWESDWWSGNNGDDGVVVVPGFDSTGNKMTVNYDHAGSYRLIDRSSLGPILDQGNLGADNTTLWVSFQMQRDVGCDHLYGGLSLNWQWVGEQMFLGSPWSTGELGFARTGAPSHEVVTGSDVNLINTLVYRIDFLPGDERIQFWLNPTSSFPTTPADIDSTVTDFRFNEVRLQSGDGLAAGFSFDAVEIATPAFRPTYAVTNAVAGGTANFDVINCTGGNRVIIGYSMIGAGPTQTMFGDVDMTPPIGQLPAQVANALGEVHLVLGVPPGLSGVTVWTQCVELLGGGGGILSNSLAVTL